MITWKETSYFSLQEGDKFSNVLFFIFNKISLVITCWIQNLLYTFFCKLIWDKRFQNVLYFYYICIFSLWGKKSKLWNFYLFCKFYRIIYNPVNSNSTALACPLINVHHDLLLHRRITNNKGCKTLHLNIRVWSSNTTQIRFKSQIQWTAVESADAR